MYTDTQVSESVNSPRIQGRGPFGNGSCLLMLHNGIATAQALGLWPHRSLSCDNTTDVAADFIVADFLNTD